MAHGVVVGFFDVVGPDGTEGEMLAAEDLGEAHGKGVGAAAVVRGHGRGVEADEQQAAGIGDDGQIFRLGQKPDDAADGEAAGVGDDDGFLRVALFILEQRDDALGDNLGGFAANGFAAKDFVSDGIFDEGNVVVIDDVESDGAGKTGGELELEVDLDGRPELEELLFFGVLEEAGHAAMFLGGVMAVEDVGDLLGAVAFKHQFHGAIRGAVRRLPGFGHRYGGMVISGG